MNELTTLLLLKVKQVRHAQDHALALMSKSLRDPLVFRDAFAALSTMRKVEAELDQLVMEIECLSNVSIPVTQ